MIPALAAAVVVGLMQPKVVRYRTGMQRRLGVKSEQPATMMVVGSILGVGGVAFGLCAFGPFWFIPATVIGLAGGWVFLRGLRIHLGRAAFRVAKLTLDEQGVPMGGTARIRVRLEPKDALKITTGSVTLCSQEEAVYSAGTNSRTYRQEIHRQALSLRMPTPLTSTFAQELSVTLPPEVPATFYGRYNSLYTVVKLELGIDGWPDLLLEEELMVRPEVPHA